MATGSFNPFSAANNGERLNFPKFSPIFKSSTPVSETKKPFRWSIDQLARLKPTPIDTNDSALALANKHSPYNDAAKQSELDNYFMQTALPSPWPAASRIQRPPKAPPTAKPSKHVTFLAPATTFVSEEKLVESQVRDGNSVDACTQTTLTFPSNFDLEKLLASLSDQEPVAPDDDESSEREGLMDDETSLGNSLRRKLFGQPDRQSLPVSSMELTSHEDAPPEEAPGHSSMVNSPGRLSPALSPIGELVEPLEPHYPSLSTSPGIHMSVLLPACASTASNNLHTPHRYVMPYCSSVGAHQSKPSSTLSLSPIIGEDILRRKEALKCFIRERSPAGIQASQRASTVSPQYTRSSFENSYRGPFSQNTPVKFRSPTSPGGRYNSPSIEFFNKLVHSNSSPVPRLCHSFLSPVHKRMKLHQSELHHY